MIGSFGGDNCNNIKPGTSRAKELGDNLLAMEDTRCVIGFIDAAQCGAPYVG